MTADYVHKHIGITDADTQKMATYLGVKDALDLVQKTVPQAIYCNTSSLDKLLEKPPLQEHEALAKLKSYIQEQVPYTNMIGTGYYPTLIPAAIKRYLLENPGWYTPYTPYQSEISQGRLEMLFHFQTLCSELTSLPLANASLLDEATAACEAMAMSKALSKERTFFVDKDLHPQSKAVLTSRASGLGITLWIGDLEEFFANPQRLICGGVTQYPNTKGHCQDLREFSKSVHSRGGLAACATDLLALTLITSPGEMDFDIAFGSSQRFGVPMGYGGPHAAFFVTRMDYKRLVPGRVVGRSQDRLGARAYRLALQTREQHIRREKATSHICTAQALLASMATAYAIYHGKDGLIHIARKIHQAATLCFELFKAHGFSLYPAPFFDTLHIITTTHDREAILTHLANKHINVRTDNPESLGISFGENTTTKVLQDLLGAFGIEHSEQELTERLKATTPLLESSFLNSFLKRTSSFLSQEIFHKNISEIGLMRYLKALENKDLSLTHSMIPLGSCTMKLSSAAACEPLSWPQFAEAHPHQPSHQLQGYRKMLSELENMLALLTGMSAVSLQPNSGAQGELAGLITIRHYFASTGSERNICLIPSSAHGTNPASAATAGLKVVVVKCDEQGNIDISSLEDKLAQYGEQIAAMMVTYPSTHGVFEEGIKELCEKVHSVGAQVYLDGANLNAQLEVCRPGEYGIDVCHLNLHKTFCIPHGGGGPGAGPIAVAQHLAPFLPKDPYHLKQTLEHSSSHYAVSAALYGSPLILTIPWMYITMMGSRGLRRATETAILSANYLAKKLGNHYPVLYSGRNGYVAHECLFDIREITKTTRVTVEDIAKRLMDYGYHAPTISFPIPGTMMIEPTECESLEELERFVEAMISIREEITNIEEGQWNKENNPLKNAPHPWHLLTDTNWSFPYSRKQATSPLPYLKENKFWPSVARVDNALGDRSLVCACEPIESYEDS